MEFLASRVRDPSIGRHLADMARANVDLLDLSDPSSVELVDLIVEELPGYVARLHNAEQREYLSRVFADRYKYAREQQNYNQDPLQDTYFTIGPNPARYFRLDNLERRIVSQLSKTDYVRIDVSEYTPEQRALVREYVKHLGNQRVLIVGDDDARPIDW
ncbi:hypothetical protein [Mycobacterium sp. TY814]|uniref:hypothetical protein n=2 Tax=unclassified Mycobacterium TaxID=2642494 RepID=UPI00274086B3|nr:hypothetical protein [Mycobacterium sp. TY814]MDP7722473.1 hypothetical protein [Mycobacterium sp. TY814]